MRDFKTNSSTGYKFNNRPLRTLTALADAAARIQAAARPTPPLSYAEAGGVRSLESFPAAVLIKRKIMKEYSMVP